MINWIPLDSNFDLNDISNRSFERCQIIFKHSTRCSISVMVKNRLERESAPTGADFYYLDLLQFREHSNQIAQLFKVHHESPQILLIKNGSCIYHESHHAIEMDEIAARIF